MISKTFGFSGPLLIFTCTCITLLFTVSSGHASENCVPRNGGAKTDGNTLYMYTKPPNVSIPIRAGAGYEHTFIFNESCTVMVTGISLQYFGSCSVAFTYYIGNISTVLETFQFAKVENDWITVTKRLSESASSTLYNHMQSHRGWTVSLSLTKIQNNLCDF
eukprot:scpid105152/ scgid15211/ 